VSPEIRGNIAPARLEPLLQPDGRSDARVVTQFFLVPLAVVAGLVGIFVVFAMASRHPPTLEDQLKTLQSGRFNQRWQAAFELSNLLRGATENQQRVPLVRALTRVFRQLESNPDTDPRARRYLALALGYSRSRQAVPALLQGTGDRDGETRIYCLWGLARLGAAEGEGLFHEGLSDPDPSIRSVSVYGLGMLPGSKGMEELREALTDKVEDVRWNAALALGRRGDSAGVKILADLLDRRYLARFTAMSSEEKTSAILNSLRALSLLNINGLDGKIQELARSDPDPRIRMAARSWRMVPLLDLPSRN